MGRSLQLRFAAAQPCQPSGTLPLHQSLEGFPQQARALGNAAQLLGPAQQVVVKGDGGAHRAKGKPSINLRVN
jgi:hypothetical protein